MSEDNDIVDFYVHINGKIIKRGRCPRSFVSLQAEGDATAVIGNAAAEKILDTGSNQLADRKVSPISIDKTVVAADGEDYVTISGIPDNATLDIIGPISDRNRVLSDDILEITFGDAGQYIVTISCFPFLSFREIVNAS